MCRDRLNRSGAFKPSHRQGIVVVGIGRGKIVDCAGYLGIGLVGRRCSAKEKAHGYSHRGPLVCTGVTIGVSRQSK